MTYIRMTGGRDRGYVKDFPVPEAREMLALGQALPVDFDQPDALGFREMAAPETELQLLTVDPPARIVTSDLPTAQVVAAPPSRDVHSFPRHGEGKKKR
jgi:hypothetical protein